MSMKSSNYTKLMVKMRPSTEGVNGVLDAWCSHIFSSSSWPLCVCVCVCGLVGGWVGVPSETSKK
ncbi:hypothetical protein E2C01_003805 [Portunus trituberculatus]|uniref:Uncharacterized protein n=1 Tax=Portunus trituberculatus TaxID=210409 RepID=A0A5B7CPM0_PORTR|nr:hypothetical protein [Portunus trituberculatus]